MTCSRKRGGSSKRGNNSKGSNSVSGLANYFAQSNYNVKWFFFFVFLILFTNIVTFVLYMTTSFEKKIQIKEKYISGYKGGGRYFVVDSEDNVYKLVDTWFLGEFDRGSDYGKITKGETYTVKGYGIRIPVISHFPRIYDISK